MKITHILTCSRSSGKVMPLSMTFLCTDQPCLWCGYCALWEITQCYKCWETPSKTEIVTYFDQLNFFTVIWGWEIDCDILLTLPPVAFMVTIARQKIWPKHSSLLVCRRALTQCKNIISFLTFKVIAREYRESEKLTVSRWSWVW